MTDRKLSSLPKPAVAPSVLASDVGRLADEVRRVQQGGADVIHLDVMDGHFVPNLTFGPAICQAVRDATDLCVDVHLMLDNPADYFEPFARAGADNITFHAEVTDTPREFARQIHDLGCQAGITVNPDGDVELMRPAIEDVELVLIMSVYAGFGGQKFIPEMLEKVRTVRSWLRDDQRLEIDGGINPQTGRQAVGAGADLLVAGTAVFKAPDVGVAISALRGET